MQTLAQKSTGVEAYAHEAEHAHDDHHSHPQHGFFRTYVWSHDHKMIGPSTSSPASSSWP